MNQPLRLVPSDASDDTLMRDVAAQKRAALEQLFQRYSGRVLASARRVLANSGEAEEVVQETFIEVWNKAAGFDARRGNAASWILSVGRNKAIDRARSRSARTRLLANLPREENNAESPQQALERATDQRRLGQALETLTPEQREVIELAYFGGLSQTEIAAKTGDALGTIKGRARAGLARLTEKLRKELP